MLIGLHSDTELIDAVSFRKGINIIRGKYSEDKEARGINGIGKSSLVRLINFCLLSRKAEKLFSKKKYDFLRKQKHSVTLEFEIQPKKYFLKRTFSNPHTIYLGNHFNKLEEYEKSEMPKILESIFFPTENAKVFFEGNRYRTIMEFFIKDDLQNQQRIDPLNFVSYNAKAIDKALYNFYLLNLPTKNIVHFNDVLNDYKKKSVTVKGLTDKVKEDTGKELTELRTEMLKIEKRIFEIDRSLKEYNFLENHKDIEVELTTVISLINEKSTLYNATNRKLNKLKSSYSYVPSIDTNRIQKLYNETVSTFGDHVKKKLDEVIKFKEQLLANRKKYLLNEEKKLTEIIQTALNDLESLEKKRSQLYSFLKEKGALDQIETTYENLIQKRIFLETNNAIIREIDDVKTKMAGTDIKISELRNDIVDEVNEDKERLNVLRLLFQEVLENAVYLDEELDKSYFDVRINLSKNRSQLPFSIKIELPKADALGQERLKIVSYDLMVFLNSRIEKRNLPDFLIHDGVFHAISKKTIYGVLKYMFYKASELQNFQYIITFNEDEIEFTQEVGNGDEKLAFNISDFVVAEFTDTENETLFKRFF